MKFIHTADWQLGKPFGRFESDVRAALHEARFDAIDAIGRSAVEYGVAHVVVAGDVFDTEGPEDRTIVQAVSRMQRYPCRWWLLPGNHDYARNGGLWDRVRSKAADNTSILSEPEPRELEQGVWLLPAPLTYRHNLDDPTELFDGMETPAAKLKIGLAHGSIRDFGSRGDAPNFIDPARAKLSSLDYLALGDWHGCLQVDSRTWYSGTHETDRFQRDEPGHALLVEVQPNNAPSVTKIRTGKFKWLKRDWRIDELQTFESELKALRESVEPATTLLQLSLSGIASLSDRIAILDRLENVVRHELRYLDLRPEDLVARPTDEDFAALSVEGMLGAAAGKLNAKIQAGGPEASIAKRALERLFVEYARGDFA